MVEVRLNKVVVRCDCAGCSSSEEVEDPAGFEAVDHAKSAGRIFCARQTVEYRGWFIERFSKKIPREFCPTHAPAYRTAFHMVQEARGARRTGAALVLLLASLALSACGSVEGTPAPEDTSTTVRGRIEVDAGSGAGGAPGTGGAQEAGAGGAAMSGAGGAPGVDAGRDADPGVEVAPLPPCAHKVALEICDPVPKTAVCYRDDGSLEVGCISDPIYRYTCVGTCSRS